MPSRIITPPVSELTSFEAFSAAITTAPFDELHIAYESDGEDDLEGDYEEDGLDENLEDESGITYPATLMADPFDDSDNDSDAELHKDSSPYEFFDPRFDIDRTNLTPGHANSRHINPELQSMVDETEVFLEQLSLKFQPMIEEQPMSTTIVLANQAVEQVLMPYRVHGSQARLSESAMKFLNGGSKVRRPGKEGLDGSKDGELRFVEHMADEKENRGRNNRLKRKADENVANESTSKSSGLKIKIVKRSDGTSTIVPATPNPATTPTGPPPPAPALKPNTDAKNKSSGLNVFGERVGYGFQSAGTLPLDGPKAQVDLLSNRKTSGPLGLCELQESASQESIVDSSKETEAYGQDTITSTSGPRPRHRRPLTINTTKHTKAKTLFTPLANSFSTIAIQTPTSPPSDLSQATTACDRTDTYSCTINPAANAALALEAYNPISMKFTWPASTIVNGRHRPCMPTPTILDAFNNIIRLYNAEGRNMLSYYIRKYDTSNKSDGPSLGRGSNFNSSSKPSSCSSSERTSSNEPPHALFRLGISQYLHSKLGTILATKNTDELGLNPEARRILGEVWERHPSVNAEFSDGFDESDNSLNNNDDDGESSLAGGSIAFRRSASPSLSSTEALPDHESEMDIDSDVNSTPEDIGPEFAKRRNLHKFNLGLNPVERALLARACNVSVETVEAYWDDMREKTQAWGAMKLWCEVQSKKKIEKAKREGRW